MDSPGDESASLLLDNDDNPSSPTLNLLSRQNNPSITNNQISKRTLDKRRKLLKSSVNQHIHNKSNGHQQQQNSLRYESLIRRKRILELTSQKLLNDRECLLIEKKNLEIKLATNEYENERNNIDKRRLEITLQKYQNDTTSSSSPNGNNHLSDQEDHDDNNSPDNISDFNE
jgi:hypothetical protein